METRGDVRHVDAKKTLGTADRNHTEIGTMYANVGYMFVEPG